MKDIKEAINVSGETITKIGSMSWKQVLTFLVVILILLGAFGVGITISTRNAAKEAAAEAVKAQVELEQKIHDLEMNMRLQNSSALNKYLN